jgi:hypothetical protein
MHNCLLTGHCIKAVCDQSCPDYITANYLLERNNISINSKVFKSNISQLQKYTNLLENSEGKLVTIISNDTNATAEMITYSAICKHWKNSRLHTVVYNLKLSQYIDTVQSSWSGKSSEDVEYQKIWISGAKVLIISNIDYINFKEYQCQTLLSLLQSRDKPELTTIIVSPSLTALVGGGQFFGRLHEILNKTIVTVR